MATLIVTIDSWQIIPSDGIVSALKDNSTDDCRFVSQITDFSFMSQRVNLTRFIPLTSRQRAILILTIRDGGQNTSVEILDHFDRLLINEKFSQGKFFIFQSYDTR